MDIDMIDSTMISHGTTGGFTWEHIRRYLKGKCHLLLLPHMISKHTCATAINEISRDNSKKTV